MSLLIDMKELGQLLIPDDDGTNVLIAYVNQDGEVVFATENFRDWGFDAATCGDIARWLLAVSGEKP